MFSNALARPESFSPRALADLADVARIYRQHATADVLATLAGRTERPVVATRTEMAIEAPTVSLKRRAA